jgi:sugar/nucleoside kinase (ribokinase family)
VGDAPFASSSPDRPDVVVVGDVMADVSVEAGALAVGGDVHGEVRIRPAGGGANAAVWAAQEGAGVRLYGRVGDDLMGRLVRSALSERGIEPLLGVDPDARTGAMLVVRAGSERSMVADRGANARLSPEDLPPVLEAGAVLVSGYLLFDPGSEPAALAALDRARADVVAVDAASWPLLEAYGPDRFFEATERATLLLLNEHEAEALTGERSEAGWAGLSDRYREVCVKRGGEGARLLVRGEERLLVTGTDAGRAVDATGAGDAFDGAFLGARALGVSLEDALGRACEAGARVANSLEVWPER